MLCDPHPPLSLPLAPLLLGWGGFPGLVTHPLGQKRGDFGEIVVPGVSEEKLVEKVARKQQEMLPSKTSACPCQVGALEPGGLGQVAVPRKRDFDISLEKHALPPPHLLTQTLQIRAALCP